MNASLFLQIGKLQAYVESDCLQRIYMASMTNGLRIAVICSLCVSLDLLRCGSMLLATLSQ
jgi:hypothetical protein